MPLKTAREGIEQGKAFRQGSQNLYGRPSEFRECLTYGDLPEPYRSELKQTKIDFVIFSYETPIAWRNAETGAWRMPKARYSITTTRHQETIAAALGLAWRSWEPGTVAVNKGRGKSPYGPRTGGI